jgi:thiamine biosynthesis lipoprotein
MKTMKSNRRDFLRGAAAADAIAEMAAPLSAPAGGGYLTRLGRQAMACQFEVLFKTEQCKEAIDAAVAALDLVDELESQLTVYRETSEVSRINQTAHADAVEVEPRLFELFERAAEIHQATSGAYDIATGALTKLWGFFRRQGKVPDTAELSRTMEQIGMQHVQLDRERRTIRLLKPGVEINLGSIGKGYALDRMAEILHRAGISDFLLHGGNSSVLGHGQQRGENVNQEPGIRGQAASGTLTLALSRREREQGGWRIGITHPLDPGRRIGEIAIRDRALGTSGSSAQFFVHDGRRYGHILDPRTGWPAEKTLATTVAAPIGAEADALATAFYVLGVDG